MINQMYVVYDSKAQIYNKPFYFINHQVAIRAARELLGDPNTEITKHPRDFTMFHIGEYDDETAHVKPSKIMEPIVRFHELAAQLEIQNFKPASIPEIREAFTPDQEAV